MPWKKGKKKLPLLQNQNYEGFYKWLHFLTGSATSGRHLPSLIPSSLWSVIPSSLPPMLRGGPNEGNLQISPINHEAESNITNILQLEETAVRPEPSISSPHDRPRAGLSHHSFSRRPCRKREWDRGWLCTSDAGLYHGAVMVKSQSRKTRSDRSVQRGVFVCTSVAAHVTSNDAKGSWWRP